MADAVLHTERLVLRPPVQDDLAWVQEHINTKAVMRYLGGKPRDPADVEQSFADDVAAFDTGGHRRWTVCSRADDRRIGRCGLFTVRTETAPPELHGQREIGWTLAEPFWGNGYATEAARAVLDHAFGTMSCPVVYSQTSDSNGPSTRMMQRLGLHRRSELDYVDPVYPERDNPTTVWSITAQDWQAMHD